MTYRSMSIRLAMLAACAASSIAQSEAGQAPLKNTGGPGDSTVVDFVLPGQFEDALARAKKRNRPLLIKGVAFGVDKLGATCATKGKW